VPDTTLINKITACLRELGAGADLPSRRNLTLYRDASGLELAHVSKSGREHFLVPGAAAAWRGMRAAAARDGVELVMISGFRSFDQQLALIRDLLAAGQAVDQVLTRLAPPGCSEHHTGCAVDIGTPGCKPLSEEFEETNAFKWLAATAEESGFRMSYPRGNRWGFLYEPWHWCYSAAQTPDR
jgi:D-alanyl-D-alanine carboxypeptidase